VTTRRLLVRAPDGGELTGHLAVPASGAGPGVVVLHEVFGVTAYVRRVCARLAGLGYVALALELYWRLEPEVDIDEASPGGVPRALGLMRLLDLDLAAGDAGAALRHLRGLEEVGGRRVGVLGFCLGGGIAYLAAARADPDAAVSYYARAVPDALGEAGRVTCPILFHFGAADELIPADRRAAVRQAFASHPTAEFREHPGAGHAFDNDAMPHLYHAGAAAEAWRQTADFLARTLYAG
jgi:carboxymethylenebutenolidase